MERKRHARRHWKWGVAIVTQSSKGVVGAADRVRIPLPFLVRLAVGIPLLLMALAKLWDPIEFLKLTHQYGVLPIDPPVYVNTVAIVVPWVEVLCGLGILFGMLQRGAALLVVGMMLFFTPMLVMHANYLLAQHPDKYGTFCNVCFDCGCGTGVVCICTKVLENVGFFVGGLYLWLSHSQAWSVAGLLRRKRSADKEASRSVAEPAAS